MRLLLIAITATTVLWWLLRPRSKRRRRHAAATAWPEPHRHHLRSFRTAGGIETTVYEVKVPRTNLYNQPYWKTYFGWRCDCGADRDGAYEYKHEAQREAIGHHQQHTRGAA